MNNLPSYYGLVDARISASDKYLPVPNHLTSAHNIQEQIFSILTKLLLAKIRG